MNKVKYNLLSLKVLKISDWIRKKRKRKRERKSMNFQTYFEFKQKLI